MKNVHCKVCTSWFSLMATLFNHVYQPVSAVTTFIYDILKENLSGITQSTTECFSYHLQFNKLLLRANIVSHPHTSYKKSKLYIA